MSAAPIPTISPAPVEVVEPSNGDDDPQFSHIIRKDDEMRGYAGGETVTALCGKTWVPTRDPQKFPVCTKCLETLKGIRSAASN